MPANKRSLYILQRQDKKLAFSCKLNSNNDSSKFQQNYVFVLPGKNNRVIQNIRKNTPYCFNSISKWNYKMSSLQK